MNLDITRVSSKGQVVIPHEIRKQLGLKDGEALAITVSDNLIVLKRVESKLEVEDIKTLELIKEAWREIADGKCKRLSKEAFLAELEQW